MHVLVVAHHFEMPRVDAVANAAEMVDLEPGWDGLSEVLKREPVTDRLTARIVHPPVAPVSRPRPQPAAPLINSESIDESVDDGPHHGRLSTGSPRSANQTQA
jgi:hypothetical protein